MRGIAALLDEVIIDLLGCQVDNDRLILGLEQRIVIILLAREGAGADDLDLSALIDEDVGGVHVTDLSLQVLKFLPRSDDVVQQVPHLSLQEVLFQLGAVLNLGLEDEFVVVEGELHGGGGTRTRPPEPQRPTGSKACLTGRKRTSLVSESSICSMERTHSLYNF